MVFFFAHHFKANFLAHDKNMQNKPENFSFPRAEFKIVRGKEKKTIRIWNFCIIFEYYKKYKKNLNLMLKLNIKNELL